MTDFLLSTNRISGAIRRETLDGRDYLVAPVVALVAGVLNQELVPVEEIERAVDAWNGRPVVLGHPRAQGLPISANSPELEKQIRVGWLWNVEMAKDRIRGEIWVDVEKAKRMGGDAVTVLQRLEANEGIEVSTAYWRDLDEIPGQLNGEHYTGIARNLRSDHLALLLWEEGACSWKDGCGVPRVNQKERVFEFVANQHKGVMVALFPPAAAAESLALNADELPAGSIVTPANEMHLTLVYLGDLDQSEAQLDQGEILRRVMEFANTTPIIRGMVSGIGRFTTTNEEGMQALFALYDCDYLHHLRWWLADWLPVVARNGKGFIPHLTLAYLPAEAPTPNLLPEPREVIFDRIGVAWGNQVTLFPLQGEAAEVAANENKPGFNPFTAAKAALRGLASALGFKAAQEPGPITNTAPDGGDHPTEEVSMKKEELIAKLIANKRCMLDKTDMENMSEGALQKMLTALEGGCGGNETPAATPPQSNATATAPATPAIPQELQDLTTALKELGGVAGIKSALATIQANADQRKVDLVAELKANERCAFDEGELQAMSQAQLEKLATSLRPADYSGRGGPRGNAGHAEEDQVPEPPKVVLAEPAK